LQLKGQVIFADFLSLAAYDLQAEISLSDAICFGDGRQSIVILSFFILQKFLSFQEICDFLIWITASLKWILLDIEKSGFDCFGTILYVVLAAERQRLYCGICYRALIMSD